MDLHYTIEQHHYEDTVAFQLRLRRAKKASALRYYISNGLLCGFAVYFFLFRPEYAWYVRLAPVVIAAVMIALTTAQRSCSPRTIQATVRRYIKLKIIEPGYLGPHSLSIDSQEATLTYGQTSQTIALKQCSLVHGEDSVSFLLGGGVIFEIIPNDVLNTEDHRATLSALLAEA